MKIKAITTFRGWKDGSGFTYESVYSVEEIEVSPGVSLSDQVERAKDWYEVVKQDGENTVDEIVVVKLEQKGMTQNELLEALEALKARNVKGERKKS